MKVFGFASGLVTQVNIIIIAMDHRENGNKSCINMRDLNPVLSARESANSIYVAGLTTYHADIDTINTLH